MNWSVKPVDTYRIMNPHKILKALKRIRQMRRMTLSEVATKSGVSANTIARMESGKMCSFANLVYVMAVLGVTFEELEKEA